jgi:NADH dehydrogenase (ubiquinone) Fe-S protein 1
VLIASDSALSEIIGQPLPYDDVLTLRDRMWDISPTLVRYDTRETSSAEIAALGLAQLASSKASASTTALKKPIADFYRTDPISRASVTMAACSKAFVQKDYQPMVVDDMTAQVGSLYGVMGLGLTSLQASFS